MSEPIVIPARKMPYNKEYIAQLRATARKSVDEIKEKPTLQDLYKTVDLCWQNPVFLRQKQFQNKDQHYAYITEYYKSQISEMTLEDYKKTVLASIMTKIDAAERLLESEKYIAAAREHKRMQDEHLNSMQEQVVDLEKRNTDIANSILKEVKNDSIRKN